jgi:hypothetical protein
MTVNWGLILNWQTFESLAGTIFLFEESARICGRIGRDYAIDSVSKDETKVYQFKYHEQDNPQTIISDALRELEKITKHKKDGGKGQELWAPVTDWLLVSSCTVNPQANADWKKSVEPEFKKIGINAGYASREELEALLTTHPHIYKHFFQNQFRQFLSVDEAKEYLQAQSFHESEYRDEFVGRSDELKKLKEFIESEKKLIYIDGPGGVGKTRLLFQTAQLFEDQIGGRTLWAQTATLERADDILSMLIPEQQNLILIDEPQSTEFILSLLEQLSISNHKINKWKVALTIRSQNDPMLKILEKSRSNVIYDPICLERLEDVDTEDIANMAVSQSSMSLVPKEKEDLVKHLVHVADGHPIWIFIGLKLVEERGSTKDLPDDQTGIARSYVDELIKNAPTTLGNKSILNEMIKWQALLFSINIEDQATLDFINSVSSGERNNQITDLISYELDKRFVRYFGRLRKIKPDVLRHYILLDALATKTRMGIEVSGFAKSLIDLLIKGHDGNVVPLIENIIQSISYAEFRFKDENIEIKILDEFVDKLMKMGAENDPKIQKHTLDLAENLSLSRPLDYAKICRTVRINESDTTESADKYFGKYSDTHKSIVIDLAHELGGAARFATNDDDAKSFIVDELVELLKYESQLPKDEWNRVHNDGKRANKVLEKLASAGPAFFSRYDTILFDKANELVDQLEGKPMSDSDAFIFRGVVDPVISIRREYVLSEGGAFSFNWYILPEDSEPYRNRQELLKRLWTLLHENVAPRNRQLILSILNDTSRNAHNASDDKERANLERETKQNLQRILDFIKNEWVSPSELRVAREIWDWHRDYDERPDFKEIADQCENEFLSRPRAELYDYLFKWDYEDREVTVPKEELDNFISWLLSDPSGKHFKIFLEEGLQFANHERFFGSANKWINHIKDHFGSAPVSEFIFSNINSSNNELKKLALQLFGNYMLTLREQKEIHEIIRNLEKVKKISPEAFLDAINYTYNFVHISVLGIVNKEEYDYVIKNLSELVQTNESRIDMAGILTKMFYNDWNSYCECIDNILIDTDANTHGQILAVVIRTLDWVNLSKKGLESFVTAQQTEWIFEKLKEVPDLDIIGENVDYDLGKLCKETEWRPDIKYLLSFIDHRSTKYNTLKKEQKETEYNFWPGVYFDIFKYLRILEENSSEEDVQTLKLILKYSSFDYPVGYNLPKILQKLDPKGLFLPYLICAELEKIEDISDVKDILIWSRYAGKYPETTEPWRLIALSACKLLTKLDIKDQNRVLWSFEQNEIESWSGTYGELHPRWEGKVKDAEVKLQSESDESLKRYFSLKLKVAIDEFKRRKIEHEEEHGDK